MSTSADPTSSEVAVADEEVEGSRPVACWSVREGDWRDELPDEVAALLAPPVIVSAEAPVPAGRRPSTRDNAVPVGYDPRHAAPEDPPRFITPGLPRRLGRLRPEHAA
ncbi:MAG: hypothetical protein JWP76_4663 [Dactylosporangium sp.]|nr:hypothetical protein [Dactylosporangium sp.]